MIYNDFGRRREELKYYFDSRIRYSELDENLCLPLHGLINYFQDCSTFQSEELGIGVQYLKEKRRLWCSLPGRLRFPGIRRWVKKSAPEHGRADFADLSVREIL